MATQIAPKFVHKSLDTIADQLDYQAKRLAKLSEVARNGCAFLSVAHSSPVMLADLIVQQVQAQGRDLEHFDAFEEED